MFSDEIFSSYMKIYQAISEYSDYCEVRKKDTIKAMYALYKMIYALFFLSTLALTQATSLEVNFVILIYTKIISNNFLIKLGRLGDLQGFFWQEICKCH